MHGNYRPHVARVVKDYPCGIDWPRRTPDLNPMKHLYLRHARRLVRNREPESTPDLRVDQLEVRENITTGRLSIVFKADWSFERVHYTIDNIHVGLFVSLLRICLFLLE